MTHTHCRLVSFRFPLTKMTKIYKILSFLTFCPVFVYIIYIPVQDILFILCAPNFGAAGLAPLPLPAAKGLALVVGGGAAIAAQGSSSSTVAADFTFKGFDDVLGAGAAMEPHKSSSSSFSALTVLFGRKLVAEEYKIHKT